MAHEGAGPSAPRCAMGLCLATTRNVSNVAVFIGSNGSARPQPSKGLQPRGKERPLKLRSVEAAVVDYRFVEHIDVFFNHLLGLLIVAQTRFGSTLPHTRLDHTLL